MGLRHGAQSRPGAFSPRADQRAFGIVYFECAWSSEKVRNGEDAVGERTGRPWERRRQVARSFGSARTAVISEMWTVHPLRRATTRAGQDTRHVVGREAARSMRWRPSRETRRVRPAQDGGGFVGGEHLGRGVDIGGGHLVLLASLAVVCLRRPPTRPRLRGAPQIPTAFSLALGWLVG